MREVVIIGGGISGLTCGYHLAEAGYKVIVVEKEAILGGLARSFFINGKWLPLTYRHILFPDETARLYINKFGLFSQLRWIKSSQAFWFENKPYLLSRPQHIFRFSPLDFTSKVKLFYFGLHVWLKKDWENLKGIDCNGWLKKVVGIKTVEVLFQNLMDIKFSMPLSEVSAAWLGKRLHQSIRNGDRYGYIESGWHELISKMAEGIREKKGMILNNFEVIKINSHGIEGIDEYGKLNSISGDAVVSTIPTEVFNNVINLSDNRSSKLLGSIKYKSLISFVCGSSMHLSECYWSVILKPRLIFGGFFNYTVLSSRINNDSEYIYYFFTYLESDDPLFNYDDEAIKNIYLNDIRNIFPKFSINWYKIFKIKYSQPIFTRDYKNPLIEPVENIYLAGVYRQFPKPRTMDAAFYSGFETAQYMIKKYEKK